jgi:phosphoribosylformylglycinamidine cyclo-ligase
MLRTFNCGIGMIVVTASADTDAVMRALREAGEAPVILGEVVRPDAARVATTGGLRL